MWLTDKIEDAVENAKNRAGAKKPLTRYEYHYGGNMCGNSHRESIAPVDEEHAIISISHADWHWQDPTVSEYLTDIAIMKELEAVFRRYSMQRWNGKKFSNIFVCDGETYGYSFDFGEAYIGFSSQHFPQSYYDKLKKFHDITEKYIEKGEKLPGLVLPEDEGGEHYNHHRPDDGKITLRITGYREGSLTVNLENGTDAEIIWNGETRLYRTGEAQPFFATEGKYMRRLYPHYSYEIDIKPKDRLDPGRYRMESEQYECEFEIK